MLSSFPTPACGVSKYTEKLIMALKDSGSDVVSMRINFHRDGKHILELFRCLVEIGRGGFDIVHIQFTPTICGPTFPAFLFFAKMMSRGTKIVITSHEKQSVYRRHLNAITSPMLRGYFKAVYYAVDAIVVLAEDHRNELLGRMKLKFNKVHVIPHGVDDAREVTQDEMREFRDKYNLGDDRLITFLGALRPSKGVNREHPYVSAYIDNDVILPNIE